MTDPEFYTDRIEPARWPPLVRVDATTERVTLDCSSCGFLTDGHRNDGEGVTALQLAAREHAWQVHDGHVDAEGWAR